MEARHTVCSYGGSCCLVRSRHDGASYEHAAISAGSCHAICRCPSRSPALEYPVKPQSHNDFARWCENRLFRQSTALLAKHRRYGGPTYSGNKLAKCRQDFLLPGWPLVGLCVADRKET